MPFDPTERAIDDDASGDDGGTPMSNEPWTEELCRRLVDEHSAIERALIVSGQGDGTAVVTVTPVLGPLYIHL